MINSPRVRVLVVSFAYYPMVGGLPQQARLLCRTLQDYGLAVTVATIRIDGCSSVDILDKVPIYRLWTLFGKADAGYRVRVYPWLLPLTLFLITYRHNYDVIHIHQASYPAALCVIIGKIFRKPTVIRITGSGNSGNIATLRRLWWLGSLVRIIIRHANCFVSLSGDITSELLAEKIPLEKILHIQNGVDTELYLPVSNQSTASIKTVLGVGRFSEEKGFDILVKAWAKVIDREPDARLVLVGDGMDLPMLKDIACQLGVDATISFEGNRDNIFDYLSQAMIFVLPSRNEGMSNSLLEAMSMGCACVVSNIPANWSVVIPEVNGLMFRKNDTDDLADRIIQLLQSPFLVRELGKSAHDTITAEFSIDVVVKKYAKLYSQLTDNNSSKNKT